MRKRVNDGDKSRIVEGYLNGLTRDENVGKTGSSAGKVSGGINEFIDYAHSSSVRAAAEKYEVEESVEKLRSLAVYIRKAGTDVEHLLWLGSMLERVKNITSLEHLEELIGTAESLDKEHLDAAIRLNELEKQTRKSSSEIFPQIENSEAKIKELESQKQSLEANVDNLKKEKQTAEENLKNQKTRLEAEYQEKLKQHSLKIEEIERISELTRSLKDFGLDLTQLEDLKKTLRSFQLIGGDAKQLVDLVRKTDTLLSQVKIEGDKLARIRGETGKLEQETKQYEKRSKKAKNIIDKGRALERMDWKTNSLEAAIKLAKAVGEPRQVLMRLELLKPYDDFVAETNRVKEETQALGRTSLKNIQKSAQTLTQITEKSSAILDKNLPALIAKTDEMMDGTINQLTTKYNELAGKYNNLNNDYVRLYDSTKAYEKALNHVICWTKFINKPETVSTGEIDHLFLTVMLPRLQIWCNSKPEEEKHRIATELTKRALNVCDEKINTFLSTPKNADLTSAQVTVYTFAITTFPFYKALREWYDSHQGSGSDKLWDADYYLTKIYEAITPKSQTTK